jgi:S-layer homology domain
MLLKQNNPKVVKGILFTALLALLASCGNSSTLEAMVKADPKLLADDVESKIVSPLDKVSDSGKTNLTPKTETTDRNLPKNFPASFPIYPKVQLQEAKPGEDPASGMLTWTSLDNSKAIADYYQTELTANNWTITKPFAFDVQAEIARAIAVKDNQKVHLTLLRAKNSQTGEDGTKLSVIYEPLQPDVATSATSSTPNSVSKTAKTQSSKNINHQVGNKQKNIATNTIPANDYVSSSSGDFGDLGNLPEQLSQPLKTVAALGILTPYTKDGNVELSEFAPNAIITRGEYARWLIAANNRYYDDDPGKKIYVVKNTNQPAFEDINKNAPDFGAIQGLAEAGLVPSRLTQDSTNLLFRPNAPLTREDLITWKVPLDTRQALPKASIEAIQESWGFQDAANIDSSAVRALYADYQNGDRSNVRRIFGFTTLFQPKKPVTRAEAAVSIWYFGFQGDGITAQEILELETKTGSKS